MNTYDPVNTAALYLATFLVVTWGFNMLRAWAQSQPNVQR